jgi:hypothetical protein
VPGARRAGILANANDPFTKPHLEAIKKARSAVPLELQTIVVHGSAKPTTSVMPVVDD